MASHRVRKNEEIRVKEVRLIDDRGEQMGVLPIEEALRRAREKGLDLVEVAPQADPVVCKIIDFGKYLYAREKREKKKQRPRQLKEMRLSTRIDEHDLETKLRRIKEFLEDGYKVRITVFFRGREIVHMDRGHELLGRVTAALATVAKVDQPPTEKGRSLQMLLVPLGSKERRDEREEP
ncbi:MAG: translation initiation factor IF-3 [Candidatus Acetothermia bacterium]|nr:translation initiation factor IF-3 [Candidatus Acetothermia bacterium]MDH7506054.1 translation initiation factor IF-3 [Candidatus Acetothermia bacterium]